tara:strand:- start:1185 stop:1931 length:747 start_codon:yes stop_codon:yes gene_type:complete
MRDNFIEDKYKLNPDKWTMPKLMNDNFVEDKYKLNPEKWTIPTKTNSNFRKKYLFTTLFFIVSIIFVSFVKNETRKVQKDINKLEASINEISIDLHEATLEYQVITSPENITELAKNNLDSNFSFYKSNQIKTLNKDQKALSIFEEFFNRENSKETSKKLSEQAKIKIAKKIQEKKHEIEKLKSFYSKPEEIPDEVKIKVAKKIKEKKFELKKIYDEPRSLFENPRVGQWAVVQVVKAFLGIPIIPGR